MEAHFCTLVLRSDFFSIGGIKSHSFCIPTKLNLLVNPELHLLLFVFLSLEHHYGSRSIGQAFQTAGEISSNSPTSHSRLLDIKWGNGDHSFSSAKDLLALTKSEKQKCKRMSPLQIYSMSGIP